MDKEALVSKIKAILDKTIPNFWHKVSIYKMMGQDHIAIQAAANNYEINRVSDQRPQAVSLRIDLEDMELMVQSFGGTGGQRIYLIPNKDDAKEKYLAMAGQTVPFRKPQKNEKAILGAIEKFFQNYKKMLIENKDRLMYKEHVDYDKLLTGEKMKKGGNVSNSDIDELVNGYKDALLFATVDYDTDESYDSKYGRGDFAPETNAKLKKMAAEYLSENKDAIEKSELDISAIGGDIFYTQAGHGAGFFDRSLDKDVEKKLTEGAEKFGDLIDIEAGDDGLIRIRGGRKGFFSKGGNISGNSSLQKLIDSPLASEKLKQMARSAASKMAEGGPVDPSGDQPDWDDTKDTELFGDGGKVTGTERNKLIYKYVIDCIDPEAYEVKADTDAEKIKFVWETFLKEYGHQIKYYKNWQKTFENWLQGLPSVMNVDYENYRIIEIGKEWGILKPDATDKQEDKFLETWWARIYMGLQAAARKNKVTLDYPSSFGKGGGVSSDGDKHKYYIKAFKTEQDHDKKKASLTEKDSLNYDAATKRQSKLANTKKYYAVGIYAKKDNREVSIELPLEFKKGGSVKSGSSVKITDNNSLFKGKTGIIVSETKTKYKVKVQDNGKDRVVEVSKRGTKMC